MVRADINVEHAIFKFKLVLRSEKLFEAYATYDNLDSLKDSLKDSQTADRT
jgi:hypothetical protein